jgi:hypothetical protein
MTAPAPRCPTCGGLLDHDTHSLLPPGERLTPWMIHDLPRIAWKVEDPELLAKVAAYLLAT